MKRWKMLTIATLAVLVVASISTFAFACYYSNGPFYPFGIPNAAPSYTPVYPTKTNPTTQAAAIVYPPGYVYPTEAVSYVYPTEYVSPPANSTYAPYGTWEWGGMWGGGWGCGCGGRGGMWGHGLGYGTTETFGTWGCNTAYCGGGYPIVYPGTATTSPITLNTAVTTVQSYLTSLDNPDLAIQEVQEYAVNFYVSIYEKSTGVGAFELLVDKYAGNVYAEPGPNMVWNTKYGITGRLATPTAVMPVTVDQAKTDAQQFLNTYFQGATVGSVQTFYGYYTINVVLQGNIYGLLSVNGYTGQVWGHMWHGSFVQEWTP